MKRRSWLVVTLVTVLLTGFALVQVARLAASRASRCTPRCIELHGQARADDPLLSEEAFRWRRCQPTHWRACLLDR